MLNFKKNVLFFQSVKIFLGHAAPALRIFRMFSLSFLIIAFSLKELHKYILYSRFLLFVTTRKDTFICSNENIKYKFIIFFIDFFCAKKKPSVKWVVSLKKLKVESCLNMKTCFHAFPTWSSSFATLQLKWSDSLLIRYYQLKLKIYHTYYNNIIPS